MKNLIAIFAVISGFFFAVGCKTNFESGGAYSSSVLVTNIATGEVSTNQVVAPDVTLYAADETYKLAYESILGIYRTEQQNRAFFAARVPKLRPYLASLRPKIIEIDTDWAKARKAYKANPTPANLSVIQEAITKMKSLLPIATSQLTIQ